MGAVPREAGAAFDGVANDRIEPAEWAGEFRIGGTEHRDDRPIEGSGDVKGTGVVADHKVSLVKKRDELAEIRSAGQIDCARNLTREFLITRRPGNDRLQAQLILQWSR